MDFFAPVPLTFRKGEGNFRGTRDKSNGKAAVVITSEHEYEHDSYPKLHAQVALMHASFTYANTFQHVYMNKDRINAGLDLEHYYWN